MQLIISIIRCNHTKSILILSWYQFILFKPVKICIASVYIGWLIVFGISYYIKGFMRHNSDSLITKNGYWYYRYPLYWTTQPKKRKLGKICCLNMLFTRTSVFLLKKKCRWALYRSEQTTLNELYLFQGNGNISFYILKPKHFP